MSATTEAGTTVGRDTSDRAVITYLKQRGGDYPSSLAILSETVLRGEICHRSRPNE